MRIEEKAPPIGAVVAVDVQIPEHLMLERRWPGRIRQGGVLHQRSRLGSAKSDSVRQEYQNRLRRWAACEASPQGFHRMSRGPSFLSWASWTALRQANGRDWTLVGGSESGLWRPELTP